MAPIDASHKYFLVCFDKDMSWQCMKLENKGMYRHIDTVKETVECLFKNEWWEGSIISSDSELKLQLIKYNIL